MRVIPSNSATAALRRIAFTLVDATDLITPEDITVTDVKVSLSIDGGTPANSTNDIVKVAGSTGEYYLELTQAEANQTAGALVRGSLTPSGCALTKLSAQIGPAEVFASSVSVDAASVRTAIGMSSANLDTQLAAIDTVVDAILVDTGTTLPASLTTIDNEIAAVQATATAIEADTQDLQTQIGVDGAGLTAIGDTRLSNLDAAVSSRSTVTTAQVNAEVDTALADIHLDHLLAADYDPAAKPGVATALLNELVGSDAGVSQFTANALELAPTGGSAPTAAAIRAEIDSNSTQLAAIRADTEDLQSRTPAALVGGRMDASVGAMAANVMTAAALATDAVSEIQSGLATAAALATVDTEVGEILTDTGTTLPATLATLATAAALATVDGEVGVIDGLVDAIKAKTDSLTFTTAGQVDANVQSINDVTLTGNGGATPWGPV